jgi:hypothetical protein
LSGNVNLKIMWNTHRVVITSPSSRAEIHWLDEALPLRRLEAYTLPSSAITCVLLLPIDASPTTSTPRFRSRV